MLGTFFLAAFGALTVAIIAGYFGVCVAFAVRAARGLSVLDDPFHTEIADALRALVYALVAWACCMVLAMLFPAVGL